MKQYIKPTIMLAAGTGSTGTSCAVVIPGEDLELIKEIVGGDISQAFAITEDCVIQVPFDSYCKFTSSELGSAQAFTS